MAKTSECPRYECRQKDFEIAEIWTAGHKEKISVIQCSRCGAVVGPYIDPKLKEIMLELITIKETVEGILQND